ncbi:MAG: YegS/Rv2252/BmrU family lipid kinase [Hungatella sp.]|nr:YegS/Rv2252/BmrU family lipid kinase [Hungatella sp.]
MGRLLFIVNPRAGKAQISSRLLEIVDIFVKYGWEVEIHTTQAPFDALETAKARGQAADMVVCSGGDGTLSETISGMMNLDNPPLLGYIPAGSTNDFASSLKIPSQMEKAAMLAVTGNPYPVDIGQFCRERHFVYVAAFGLFTEVSYMTPQEKKNLLGHQAYMLEGVKSLANIKSVPLSLESEEMCLEGDFVFGMVTNTVSVGGFKGLVKNDVALNDGLFEVLMIRTPRTLPELKDIFSSMILKEEQSEYVYRFKTSKLSIKSRIPVDWVLDGEFGGSRTEVDIENHSRRIRIVTSLEEQSPL